MEDSIIRKKDRERKLFKDLTNTKSFDHAKVKRVCQ